MSRSVATLVYSRRIGSVVRKAVLAYCADRASDDGRGIWASKQRIADEIECDRRTVIRTVNAFIQEGILQEVGTRPCRGGATVEYSINIAAVEALPASQSSDTGPPVTGSHQGQGDTKGSDTGPPKPSLNRPKPKKDKPSLDIRARKAKPKIPLPEGWYPKPLTPGTICAEIVAAWPAGRIERELSKFKDHHIRSDQRWSDWDAAWRTWIQRAGEFERGGNGQPNHLGSLRGSRPDPSLDFVRQADADLAAERGGSADHRGDRASLPPFGAG